MRVRVMLAALAATGVLVAGCGSDDDDDSTQQAGQQESTQMAPPAGEAESVTIASIKEGASMIPWLAEKQGFFEDQGLDVTVNNEMATPSIVPSLVNGRIQGVVGTWSTVPLFLSGDVDIVGLAPMTVVTEDDPYGIYVKADSPYQTMEDLEGKTIALNSLGSQSEVTVRKAAENAGLGRDGIEAVPIPFHEMPAALRAGRIDAALIQEPFITLTQADTPLRQIVGSNETVSPEGPHPNTTLLMMREFYEANPETVKRLEAAIAEGVQFALDNPDVVREYLSEYAGIDPEVAENPDLVLPHWSNEPVEAAEVQQIADLLLEYGLIEEKVDVAPAVKGGGG